jgi:hypothetical protein
MDLEQFYSLSDACMPDTAQVEPIEQLDSSAALRAEISVQLLPGFQLRSGTKWYDLLGTGYAGLYLVSERFQQVLIRGGFTGWTTISAQIHDHNSAAIGGYDLFAVTGRCGPILPERSPVVQLPKKSGVGQSLYRIGYFFDLNTWDGSDVFCPANNRSTFITERVKTALTDAHLDNVLLRKITEIEQLVLGQAKKRPIEGGPA